MEHKKCYMQNVAEHSECAWAPELRIMKQNDHKKYHKSRPNNLNVRIKAMVNIYFHWIEKKVNILNNLFCVYDPFWGWNIPLRQWFSTSHCSEWYSKVPHIVTDSLLKDSDVLQEKSKNEQVWRHFEQYQAKTKFI